MVYLIDIIPTCSITLGI